MREYSARTRLTGPEPVRFLRENARRAANLIKQSERFENAAGISLKLHTGVSTEKRPIARRFEGTHHVKFVRGPNNALAGCKYVPWVLCFPTKALSSQVISSKLHRIVANEQLRGVNNMRIPQVTEICFRCSSDVGSLWSITRAEAEEGAEVVVILLLLSLARDISKFSFNIQHFTGHLLKFHSEAYFSSASSVFMGTVVSPYIFYVMMWIIWRLTGAIVEFQFNHIQVIRRINRSKKNSPRQDKWCEVFRFFIAYYYMYSTTEKYAILFVITFHHPCEWFSHKRGRES